MIDRLLITATCAFGLTFLVACDGGEFGGNEGGFGGKFSSANNKSDKADGEEEDGSNGKSQGVDGDESDDNNGNKDGSLGGGEGEDGGLNIGDEEVDTPCHFFNKDEDDDHVAEIDGIPVEIDVSKYTLSGDGKWDGDEYLIKGDYYEINGEFFTDLDDGPNRSQTFKTHPFKLIIEKARTAKCEVIGEIGADKAEIRKGCFLKGTKILMGDKTWKKIENITKSDYVWNPLERKAKKVYSLLQGPEADKNMWTVGYKGNKTVVTQNHPFMTKSGLKMASSLTKADYIMVGKNAFEKVTYLKKNPLDPNAYVYNFKVMGNHGEAQQHMVVADGIVAGDLYLQEQLESQAHKSDVMSFISRVQ